MEEKYKQVYAQLSGPDKKAFRRALSENDFITITAYLRAAGIKRDLKDQDTEKKRGRGRPELKTTLHDEIEAEYKQLRNTKNMEYINTPPAQVLCDLTITDFENYYNDIIDRVCTAFYDDHPDIIKRPPFMWYNSLLLECKKQLPTIDIHNAQRVAAAWDAFKALMYKIGLFPMIEAFTNLTGIYKESLAKELTPQHEEIRKKIYAECRDNMVSQVGYNPMTQVNKLFLLKSVYGYSENGPQNDLVTEKTTRKIDDIPLFSIENKLDNENI